jgi:hypothetical protein
LRPSLTSESFIILVNRSVAAELRFASLGIPNVFFQCRIF